MSDYIKVNTRRLGSDAQKVGSYIAGMKTQIAELKSGASQLDDMWDGPSSEIFKQTFQDDITAMEKIVRNLENIHKYEMSAKKKYEACEHTVAGLVSGIKV